MIIIIMKGIDNSLRNYCTETTYENDQHNKIKHNGNFNNL